MGASVKVLPLFPLQLVLFPGEVIPLYIFEPRYKELVSDCKKDKISFGILYSKKSGLLDVGAQVSLHEIKKIYPDGTLDIKVMAHKLFNLKEFYDQMPDKLYSGGEVEYFKPEKKIIGKELRALYMEYELKYNQKVCELRDTLDLTSLEVALRVNLSNFKKYELLKLPNDQERQKYLVKELKVLSKIREMEDSLKDRFKLN